MGEILSSLCLVTPAVDFPPYGVRRSIQLEQEGYCCINPGTTGQALINVLVCPKWLCSYQDPIVKIILKCFKGKNWE